MGLDRYFYSKHYLLYTYRNNNIKVYSFGNKEKKNLYIWQRGLKNTAHTLICDGCAVDVETTIRRLLLRERGRMQGTATIQMLGDWCVPHRWLVAHTCDIYTCIATCRSCTYSTSIQVYTLCKNTRSLNKHEFLCKARLTSTSSYLIQFCSVLHYIRILVYTHQLVTAREKFLRNCSH